MKIKNNVWIVTGGGSGIGRELALLLLKRGARVAIADLDAAGMQETERLADASQRLSTHHLNMADKEKVLAFPQQVLAAHGAVDGIINNAGIIQPFVKVNALEYETIERVMNVNFYGTLYMVKAFLPHLLDRPEAHIVNVSSMGGFVPVPGQTLYGASKAAVKLLTEGLFSELQDTDIKVTTVFPGAVATNITENSGVTTPDQEQEAGASTFKALEASKAAEIILNGIEKNKFHILVGKDARFMNFLSRLAPKRAAKMIYKHMKDLLT